MMTLKDAESKIAHYESSYVIDSINEFDINILDIEFKALRDDACLGSNKQKHFCNKTGKHKYHLVLNYIFAYRDLARAIRRIAISKNWSCTTLKRRFAPVLKNYSELFQIRCWQEYYL